MSKPPSKTETRQIPEIKLRERSYEEYRSMGIFCSDYRHSFENGARWGWDARDEEVTGMSEEIKLQCRYKEELQAENKRLRDALEKIACKEPTADADNQCCIAARALKDDKVK